MCKEIDKIDLASLDAGAIRQSIQVLEAVKADYLVIDLISKLREELKKRGEIYEQEVIGK